jgi:uncharacterized repeat protein (TIGR03803 family)
MSFDSTAFGGLPSGGLTLGPNGNLYGITPFGGGAGLGTIFQITTGGTFTTLYSFQLADGFTRQARLTTGPDGNLYGTSRDGDTADMGTIFKITTDGIFTNLVSFQGTNGAVPLAELTVGADGQLYGTTQLGGSASSGTVFKVTTNGVLANVDHLVVGMGRDFSDISPINGIFVGGRSQKLFDSVDVSPLDSPDSAPSL